MHRPDPRGRAMLRDYRRATTTPRPQRDALWARIEASLDDGTVKPELEAILEPPVRPRGWIAPVVAVVVAAAAVMIGALALRAGEARDAVGQRVPSQAEHEVAPRDLAPAVQPRLPADAPALEAAGRAPMAPAIAPAVAPAVRPRRVSSTGEREPSEPALSGDDRAIADALAAELALVREARTALRADRPAQALALLDAHARAFPAGQMREDRQVLRIEALCAAGKVPQARAEAAMFLRTFVGSAHAVRVRNACAAP
jgi:hypothetical protein